jgi:hypothetical protein
MLEEISSFNIYGIIVFNIHDVILWNSYLIIWDHDKYVIMAASK